MGEEYGETAPFLYFVSHGDADLVEAVRKGRSEEFAAFAWKGEAPDPQAEATFARCKLDHGLAERGRHAARYRLYRELLVVRGELAAAPPDEVEIIGADVLAIRRGDRAWMIFNFGEQPRELTLPLAAGDWQQRLCSADGAWDGPGAELPGR
jgi:maltooligosyltrehalose trehalohydrolase